MPLAYPKPVTRRRGPAWRMVVLALMAWVDTTIGVVTLALVIWFFYLEQRDAITPFKLIGTTTGRYPPLDGPRSVEALVITRAAPTFILVVRPNIGGMCSEFEREFLRPSRWYQRLVPRDWFHPVAHYAYFDANIINPDVICTRAIRIISNGWKEERVERQDRPGPALFAIVPPLMLTPGEPFHCEVTADIGQAWSGEFSVRFKVDTVAMAYVRVKVSAAT